MDTSGENTPHRSALSGGLPFLCCHLYWGHSSSQYNSLVSRTDFWVNFPSVTKAILEDFFFLNAQIEVHRDCNRESNDWQVGLLFFCCLSSPMCAGIKVLTAPLWFLDEDKRTYWQSCLVQPHLSTWGCCLYANIGLTPAQQTYLLSLAMRSRLPINRKLLFRLIKMSPMVSFNVRSHFLLNLVEQWRFIDYKIYFTMAFKEPEAPNQISFRSVALTRAAWY